MQSCPQDPAAAKVHSVAEFDGEISALLHTFLNTFNLLFVDTEAPVSITVRAIWNWQTHHALQPNTYDILHAVHLVTLQ